MSYATVEQQRLAQRKVQLLPWIADPLKHFFADHSHGHGHGSHQPLSQGEEKDHLDSSASFVSTDTSATTRRNRDIQEMIDAEEASSGELFYDLFFVANLTTVTAVHYVVDYQSLTSYILFFIILWFTWLQTTLYDIRFSVDSVYERVVKLVHFAVMIGFAATTLAWNPLDPTLSSAQMNLQSMTLTLMASRFALGIQYGVAASYGKRHGKGTVPLALHSTVMIVAALSYLGLYFSFRNITSRSYIAWYPAIFVELFVVCGVSTWWKEIGFKRTHLIERMSLLTLIVMGEGIIVMLKAVNAVEKGQSYGAGWSVTTFAIVGASISVVYLFYMFYFDYTPQHVHYGSIRQQIWTCLHFPLHLAIVLAVEGLRQLTTYWSFIESREVLDRQWRFGELTALSQAPNPDFARINSVFNSSMYHVKNFTAYLYNESLSTTVLKNYATINSIILNVTRTPVERWNVSEREQYLWLSYWTSYGHADFYGIKPPYSKPGQTIWELLGPDLNPDVKIDKLYDLVFQYFFTALAVIFFMYGIMGLYVRRGKDMWDYFSVALRFAVGVTFICIERVRISATLYKRYITSPWPIPTVAFLMLLILFIDKVVGLYAYRRMKGSYRRLNQEVGYEPHRGHAKNPSLHVTQHTPQHTQSTEYAPHVQQTPHIPPPHHD